MLKLTDIQNVKMQTVVAHPPNWVDILRVFPAVEHRTGVLFAWGDKIYNPSNIQIPPWLFAHECAHSLQHEKFGSPEQWWLRYLSWPKFRLEQELEAHRVEIEAYNEHHNRHFRRSYFNQVADRLASPLYGKLVTIRKAKALLFEGRTIDE